MELQTLSPSHYPERLREIPQPPEQLFVQGTLPPADMFCLCVVGSRKHTRYGADAARHIIRGLSGAGIAIISGLALGIDTIAHTAALEAGLPTVAFPGSGLGERALYPQSNRSLARRILAEGGALVSEFEPEFRATPYAFPQRNRLMAGFSHGALIIEAREKSGTLITARLALDYNRDVFAVPGSIFSNGSQGTHRLIQDGAVPVTSADDILTHWQLETEISNRADIAEGKEAEVLKLLDTPLPREALLEALALPIHEANALLSEMEINGLIGESGGEIRKT